MAYVKKYDVGSIRLDSPYSYFIHELPLLIFGDTEHTISLSLIHHQSNLTNNPYYIESGYKLNLAKRLIISSTGIL